MGKSTNIYEYHFERTSQHPTPEDLKRLIFSYDKSASEALHRLVGPQEKGHRDLYTLIAGYRKTNSVVCELWTEITTIPEWVNWDQIERGQKIFWRYGGASITALVYLSLLGGMGSGRTVETLDRTGGFDAAVVRRRLLETAQHTLGVHKDLVSLQPGGEGFLASVRVRLLHSSVRNRIMQLAKTEPAYYSIEDYGVPINDLDCIGTICIFSTMMIWMGWPRQGIYLRQQEILDYLALWRYVAYLLGTPNDWLSSPESARKMMESILESEIKPTKKSKTLAQNIITGLEGVPPMFASRCYQNALAHWLNGSTLATELGIEKPSFWYKFLTAGQCLLFAFDGYIKRSVPSWDERNIKFTRRIIYAALIYDKSKGALGYKAKFPFKWVPDLVRTTTPLGKTSEANIKSSGIFSPGAERVAFITLLVFGLMIGCTLYIISWI